MTRSVRTIVAAALAAATLTGGAALAKSHDVSPARYSAVLRCGDLTRFAAAHAVLGRIKHNPDGTLTIVYRCVDPRTGGFA